MIEPSAYCVAALLVLAVLGACTARIAQFRSLIYPACGLVCLTLLVIGVLSLNSGTCDISAPRAMEPSGATGDSAPSVADALVVAGLSIR